MRLTEIVDTKYKSKERPSRFDIDAMRKEKERMLDKPDQRDDGGWGAYAAVDTDPNDPFIAKKKYHVPMQDLNKDAYYVYIKTIADNGLAKSNPYFPRVYNVEIEKDSSGNAQPKFNMEKLALSSSLDREALLGMGDRMFNRFEYIFPSNTPPTDRELRYTISHGMSQIIKHSAFDRAKDPQLEEALRLIKKILLDSKGAFVVDIHAANYMIRSTPHGPQLVLTDPIADMQTRG